MRNFTPEDFAGAGQYLIRNDKEAGKYTDAGFMSTVMYKVGYLMGGGGLVDAELKNVPLLISMADGWTRCGFHIKNTDSDKRSIFVRWNSWQDLCDYLNTEESQEMRFATQEEVVRVVMYQKLRWRNEQ